MKLKFSLISLLIGTFQANAYVTTRSVYGLPWLMEGNEKFITLWLCSPAKNPDKYAPIIKETCLHGYAVHTANFLKKISKINSDAIYELERNGDLTGSVENALLYARDRQEEFLKAIKSKDLKSIPQRDYLGPQFNMPSTKFDQALINWFIADSKSKPGKSLIQRYLRDQNKSSTYYSQDKAGNRFAIGVIDGLSVDWKNKDNLFYDSPYRLDANLWPATDRSECSDQNKINEFFKNNLHIYDSTGCQETFGPGWEVPTLSEVNHSVRSGFFKTPIGRVLKNYAFIVKNVKFIWYVHPYAGDQERCMPLLAKPLLGNLSLTIEEAGINSQRVQVPLCLCKKGSVCDVP